MQNLLTEAEQAARLNLAPKTLANQRAGAYRPLSARKRGFLQRRSPNRALHR
jgi:hypothetical protein